MRRGKENIATAVLVALLASLLLAAPASAVDGSADSAIDGTEVQIGLAFAGVAGTGLVDLTDLGDHTGVLIGLSAVPTGLSNPSLIVEIYEGKCGTLNSPPIYAVENTLAGYPPPPYYVGGDLPVSLASLRSGAYAIIVRTSPRAGGVAFACGNIA